VTYVKRFISSLIGLQPVNTAKQCPELHSIYNAFLCIYICMPRERAGIHSDYVS